MQIIQNKYADKKIKQIIKDGSDNLEIIFDFDRTIIQGIIFDKKDDKAIDISSLISILRKLNMLDDDYTKKTTEWFNYYHKIQQDKTLTEDKLHRLFEEWWIKHYKLLQEKGLTLETVAHACNSSYIELRDGIKDIFDFCNKNKIKITILTATGLGSESVLHILNRFNLTVNLENINIIGNNIMWNENNMMIGIKKPIIHSYNKKITTQILKTNIIIIGDGLSDADILEKQKDIKYNTESKYNILKIGIFEVSKEKFSEEYLEKYKNSFDVVLSSILDEKKIQQEKQISNRVNLNFIKNILEQIKQ